MLRFGRYLFVIMYLFGGIVALRAQPGPSLQTDEVLPFTQTQLRYPQGWTMVHEGLEIEGDLHYLEVVQLVDENRSPVLQIEILPLLNALAADGTARVLDVEGRSVWRDDDRVYRVDLDNGAVARVSVLAESAEYDAVALAVAATLESSYPLCTVTTDETIDLLFAPSSDTGFLSNSSLPAGTTVVVDGWANSVDEDGSLWWSLLSDEWLPDTRVSAGPECSSLPQNENMALFAEAYRAYLDDDYDEAIATLSGVLVRDRNHFDSLYARGRAYYLTNEMADALADFDQMAALGYDEIISHWRGSTLRLLGRCEEAVIDLSVALEEELPNPDAIYGERGMCQRLLGNLEAAADDLTISIDLNNSSSWAYFERGRVRMDLADYGGAVSDFTAAYLRDRRLDEPLGYRGISHYYRGDLAEAYDDLSEAIERNPNNPEWFVARGDVAFAQADYDAAISDYSQAIAIDPDNASARLNRGILYEQQEFVSVAAQDYERWLALAGDPPLAAEPLALGDERTFDMTYGRVYAVPLELNQGDVLSFSAVVADGEVDPVLVLLAYDGIAIAGDDDDDGSYDARFSYRVSLDGDYTLLVGHSGGGWDGRITVSITPDR